MIYMMAFFSAMFGGCVVAAVVDYLESVSDWRPMAFWSFLALLGAMLAGANV